MGASAPSLRPALAASRGRAIVSEDVNACHIRVGRGAVFVIIATFIFVLIIITIILMIMIITVILISTIIIIIITTILITIIVVGVYFNRIAIDPKSVYLSVRNIHQTRRKQAIPPK